ncbi:universal stress protein [Xenorhabdus bovienii]|uniref:Universal stress protein n=2 Tax=Xenorhabdus bovienii TaxID=40576 RepID=A0A077NM49_XENBV|nr:universal stress protein [Xenorhabdus bovienii]CDG98825.1 Universel stress protein F putative electron transfer flavoprotein with adenine nucleotide-binding domain [Xenorhabdus bovienii str. puntauvense]CDH23545.1 Universel stress protein F putative electron transfer flavoprotein with adenine nucleotide-binding domain [Xenorhabdus bovienii str. kraussei Becker Underwood]
MYKTILVPIDIPEDQLTDNAIKHAEFLAKISGAKIHLFHAVPDISRFSVNYSYHYDLLSAFAKKAVTNSEEELKKVVEKINLPKDRVSFSVTFGSPRDKVLSTAREIGADLIIVGSRRPDISTHLLGSNASGIVSYANISVLVVR